MEVVAAASAAITALGARLAGTGPGFDQYEGAETSYRLCSAVSDRLRLSVAGSHALDQLARDPLDLAARESAVLVIASEASRDPAFATELTDLVRALPAPPVADEPSTPTGGPPDSRQEMRAYLKRKAVRGGSAALVGALGGWVLATLTPEHTGGNPLAGSWTPKSQAPTIVLSITVDNDWNYRADTMQARCEGSVTTEDAQRKYRFTTHDDNCYGFVGVLSTDGQTLTVYSDQEFVPDTWARR